MKKITSLLLSAALALSIMPVSSVMAEDPKADLVLKTFNTRNAIDSIKDNDNNTRNKIWIESTDTDLLEMYTKTGNEYTTNTTKEVTAGSNTYTGYTYDASVTEPDSANVKTFYEVYLHDADETVTRNGNAMSFQWNHIGIHADPAKVWEKQSEAMINASQRAGGDIGENKKNIIADQAFGTYKYLNMWVHSNKLPSTVDSGTEAGYIRVDLSEGADNSANRYTRVKMPVDWVGWKLITIEIEDFTESGHDLANAKSVILSAKEQDSDLKLNFDKIWVSDTLPSSENKDVATADLSTQAAADAVMNDNWHNKMYLKDNDETTVFGPEIVNDGKDGFRTFKAVDYDAATQSLLWDSITKTDKYYEKTSSASKTEKLRKNIIVNLDTPVQIDNAADFYVCVRAKAVNITAGSTKMGGRIRSSSGYISADTKVALTENVWQVVKVPQSHQHAGKAVYARLQIDNATDDTQVYIDKIWIEKTTAEGMPKGSVEWNQSTDALSVFGKLECKNGTGEDLTYTLLDDTNKVVADKLIVSDKGYADEIKLAGVEGEKTYTVKATKANGTLVGQTTISTKARTENTDYGTFVCTDTESGENKTELTIGDNFRVSTTVTNYNDDMKPINAFLLIMSYDEDGRMIGKGPMYKTVKFGETVTIDQTFIVNEGAKVKAFLWDRDTIAPFLDDFELNVNSKAAE